MKIEKAMTDYTVAEEEKTIFLTPNSIIACQCQGQNRVFLIFSNDIDITSRRFALPVTLLA